MEVGSDKAADSTASGPLWQQRPYPAPGVALKRKPGAMDTNAVKKGRPEDEVIGPSLK